MKKDRRLMGWLIVAITFLSAPAFADTPSREVGRGQLAYRGSFRADRPPDWLLGRFRGYSRQLRSDVDLTISRNGRVLRVYKGGNGRTVRTEGNYVRGNFEFSRESFDVYRTDDGIRLIDREDRDDKTEYRRTDGSNDNNNDNNNDDNDRDRAPSWAVGRFRGHSRELDSDVELNINSAGRVTRRYRNQSGRMVTNNGDIRNNRIWFGRDNSYDLDRTREGLRLTREGDSGDRTEFRRDGGSSGGGGGGDRYVPNWLRGRFEGYDSGHRMDMDVTVESNGKAVLRTRDRDGKTTTRQGEYANQILRFGFMTYEVERSSNGIRLTQVNDRDISMELRKR